jgi:hypothetical protein
MDDRVARLEEQVGELTRALRGLEERLEALEARGVATSKAPAEPLWPQLTRAAGAEVRERPAAEGGGSLALLGRTLIVLGGAFLFRALTESGAVPVTLGLGLGLLYALVWLIFADRAAAHGRRMSAGFHAAAFVVIAPPLTWEAASRFHVLSAEGSAAALVAVTALALGLAWRRRLRAVAWLASLGAVLSAWALMGSVEPILPAVLVLVLVRAADDWLAAWTDWWALPWVGAGLVDLTVAFVVMRELFGEETADWGDLSVLLALFVLGAGSVAVRALKPTWGMRRFELAQAAMATLIGYGSALRLVRELPGAPFAVGLGSLVVAAACLALGLDLLGKRPARRHAFFLFGALGLVLVLGGTALVLPSTGRSILWAALAVATVWLASRRDSVTLGLHAGIYLLAAAVSSGLLVAASYGLWAPASSSWPPLEPVAWLVLTVALVAATFELPATSPYWGSVVALPGLVLLGVTVWLAAGAFLRILVPAVAGSPGAGASPAMVAGVRTLVLAAAALLLALASHLRRFRTARWLVFAVLAAGGVKLAIEDFRVAGAAELFVALALYGGALIAAPRLARRRHHHHGHHHGGPGSETMETKEEA